MDETDNLQTNGTDQIANLVPISVPVFPEDTLEISKPLLPVDKIDSPVVNSETPATVVPPIPESPVEVQPPVEASSPSQFDILKPVLPTGNTHSYQELSIDLIKPNPWQPRKVFKEEKLEELSASIREHGVLQPLVVVPLPDGTYQLIVGERRLRASKLAGMLKVPVIIRDAMEEQNKLEVALIENIQRHNLDPIEEGMAYQQLIDTYHLTQDQVAKKVGKGRTTVTNMLRLLNLPLKIQRALAEEVITEGHARAILSVIGMERQLALLDLIIRDNMTVRQVEDKAREIMDRPKLTKASRVPSDPETAALETELRGKLGTKVKVQKSGQSGKIMIEFFSQEELNAFLDKIHQLQ